MRRSLALLLLAGLLVAACASAADGDDDFFDDSEYTTEEYDDVDENNYYGNDDDEYYDTYSRYAADYDDYYDYTEEGEDPALQQCVVGGDGKVKLGPGVAPCDIKVAGVDAGAKGHLPGGVDGLYKLTGCHDGRAMYRREGSPPGLDRVLYYSASFGDWDISNGTAPNDDDILLYGGESQEHALPLYVEQWLVGADLVGGDLDAASDEYVPAGNASVACADGKVYAAPNVTKARAGPVLTDEEIEAKYRYIYEKFGHRPDPNPTVNLAFVFLLVVVGLSAVLALPYLMAGKGKKAGYQPLSTASFAQVIQQSRKQQTGHAN